MNRTILSNNRIEAIGSDDSSCQQGFTMIEVLVALTIFAVGMLALASLQITSLRTNVQARLMMERSTLALDKMEQLVGLPYDDADLDTASAHADPVTADGYTVSWTVADGTVTDTKEITVTVAKAGLQSSVRYVKPAM